jgi:hypothetical protein
MSDSEWGAWPPTVRLHSGSLIYTHTRGGDRAGGAAPEAAGDERRGSRPLRGLRTKPGDHPRLLRPRLHARLKDRADRVPVTARATVRGGRRRLRDQRRQCLQPPRLCPGARRPAIRAGRRLRAEARRSLRSTAGGRARLLWHAEPLDLHHRPAGVGPLDLGPRPGRALSELRPGGHSRGGDRRQRIRARRTMSRWSRRESEKVIDDTQISPGHRFRPQAADNFWHLSMNVGSLERTAQRKNKVLEELGISA